MHTIRLREPWQREWTHAADGTRLARYHRHFHRPSGLLDQQPVILVLHGRRLVTSTAPLRHGSTNLLPIHLRSLLLNSQPLSIDAQQDNSTQSTQLSVRIDSALTPYNQLEILCEFSDHQPPIGNDSQAVDLPPPLADWAEVRIEIHD